MIPVSRPFLPPQHEYEELLKGIWKRQWLTNMGPLSSELEIALKNHLSVNHLLFVTNGTVALQMALRALGISKGEVITTPFSFVATTSSIVWEGCKPVFVDIDKESLNIDPTKIESAITKSTKAILATHVYGNPCDIDAIEIIAKKHNLKVIYDAAHAFDVKYKDKSIFDFGDISICSLHATKLYHSIEGGIIITKNPDLLKKMAYIRNFGFDGPESFKELGINCKNSEFHAAMGLLNLNYIKDILTTRKKLTDRYDLNLKTLDITKPKLAENTLYNYAYYPIIFKSEELLLRSKKELELYEIFPRRYFYPSLSSVLPYIESVNMPVSDDIAKRVLCLPLFYDLSIEEIDLICRLLLRVQNN